MSIRGVLHVHSAYSYDGQESLARIKDELVASGISFACVTEHVDELDEQQALRFIRECAELSDERFIFIPGFEVPYLGTHIIVVGAYSYGYDAHDVQASIKRWIQNGSSAIIAHPHRNNFTTDAFMLEHTIGSEIWNSQYDGKKAPRPGARAWHEKLRKQKASYLAFGSIDLHRLYHLGGPELRMESAIEASSILANMREGKFEIAQNDTRIDSSGAVREGSPFLWMQGMLSVALITAGKRISRVLRQIGMHGMFRSIRKAIRRTI